MLNQEPRRLNATDVVLPQEGQHESTAHLPALMPSAPLDWPVERFTQALDRREVNRKALLKWIKGNLQAGIDFGQIHVTGRDKCRLAGEGRAHECVDPRHWSKPSLWKPGAEKICGMLGLIPRFPNLSEYEKATLRREEIRVIILKCELHTANGFVAAEGTGARRIDQDWGDINKSLKMAAKSAHIDSTLRVAGLSELFTQDIEDMHPVKPEKADPPAGNPPGNQAEGSARPQPGEATPPPAGASKNGSTRPDGNDAANGRTQ
jgi:hypothetical protein